MGDDDIEDVSTDAATDADEDKLTDGDVDAPAASFGQNSMIRPKKFLCFLLQSGAKVGPGTVGIGLCFNLLFLFYDIPCSGVVG